MSALHPLVRQGLEATRKKVLAEMEGLKQALAQLDEMLGVKQPEPPAEPTPTTNGSAVGKPELGDVAKAATAAAISG